MQLRLRSHQNNFEITIWLRSHTKPALELFRRLSKRTCMLIWVKRVSYLQYSKAIQNLDCQGSDTRQKCDTKTEEISPCFVKSCFYIQCTGGSIRGRVGRGGMTPPGGQHFQTQVCFWKNFQNLFNENFDDGAEILTQFTLISGIDPKTE